jgi:acyl carrier protein
MTDSQVLLDLNAIFKQFFENATLQINTDTSAKDIHNWDSMNHILLLAEIEKQFGVEFELDDLISINCVGDIISALQTKTK